MDSKLPTGARTIWIGVVFFLLSVPPGLWSPALPNILESYDALWVIPYATAVGPVVSIFSSLMFASLADRRVEAQKLLGVLSLAGAGFLYMAFAVLSWGWNPWWYVVMQGMNALISAPMWALITKIALEHAENPTKQFPLYRLWGTVGWAFAGILVSWLALDASAEAGKAAALVRILLAAAAFMLPVTKPIPSEERGLRAALGLNAFTLFRDRTLRVYFITATLIAVPLMAHYMYAPKQLLEMGQLPGNDDWFSNVVKSMLPGPTAQMTFGQITEIGAMLFLSWVGARARVKALVIVALIVGVTRFAVYALAGQTGIMMWMWLGVSLHGPCYTLFSITGQMFMDRRVPRNMRGQAQALFGLLSGSVGGSVGALTCGFVFSMTGAGQTWMAWTIFWTILSVMVLLCLVYFSIGYKTIQHTHDEN
ncbi:putative nucleoside transporter YegT [Rubritalea halochordaticola]|uniref:Nucleoside transporter YegT n=1 Tax=Rubritalea halochordaticola TaxID=714537 RepID=A0ABP9UV50_9BACT